MTASAPIGAYLAGAFVLALLLFAGLGLVILAHMLGRLEGEHAQVLEAKILAVSEAGRLRTDLAWERARAADLRGDLEVARAERGEALANQREPVGLDRIHPTPDESDVDGRSAVH